MSRPHERVTLGARGLRFLVNYELQPSRDLGHYSDRRTVLQLDLSEVDFEGIEARKARDRGVKAYGLHDCGTKHRRYASMTRCLYSNAERIEGEGRFAVVVHVRCEYDQADARWRDHHTRTYVYLSGTLAEAEQVEIDEWDACYDCEGRVTCVDCEVVNVQMYVLPRLAGA